MSDTGYTPSFERVRDVYSWAYAWRTRDNVDEGETDLSGLRESNRAEFDRALAAHDREVAAKAVEQYKRELSGFQPGHGEYSNTAALVSEPSTPELKYCPRCGCSTPNGAHFSHCPDAGITPSTPEQPEGENHG